MKQSVAGKTNCHQPLRGSHQEKRSKPQNSQMAKIRNPVELKTWITNRSRMCFTVGLATAYVPIERMTAARMPK